MTSKDLAAVARSPEQARRASVVQKSALLARLQDVDPGKVISIRVRTRISDDSFGDSFADSFGDSFSDAFGDSFGDSFSDSISLLPAETILERIRGLDPATVVGLDLKIRE